MSPTVSFGGSILAFGAIVGDKKEFQEVDCVSLLILVVVAESFLRTLIFMAPLKLLFRDFQ
jgi:hypothetical protein